MSDEHRFSAQQTAIYAAGFPQAAERVCLRIAWRQGDGWCFLTIDQISKDCAVSPATTKRALALIDRRGWMEMCDGRKTGKNGRPTKGRRIVIPTTAQPEPEAEADDEAEDLSAQCAEPEPPADPEPVSARDAEPKVATVLAQHVEPKEEVSAHGGGGGFGSSEGGVLAHPEGGFGSRVVSHPRSRSNSQLPDVRAGEAKPKPSAPAPDRSEAAASREGWRERALQALWQGWRERYIARFEGSKPPDKHLEQLQSTAAWIIRRLATKPGTPEDLAEQLLTGFWLRRDIRPRTPASWLGEKPEKYLRAAENAAIEEAREAGRAQVYDHEHRQFVEKERATAAIRNEVSADEIRAFTDRTRGSAKLELPTQLAAFRVDRRDVMDRVERALPDPMAVLDLEPGEVWRGHSPDARVLEGLRAKNLTVRPLRADQGGGWLVELEDGTADTEAIG